MSCQCNELPQQPIADDAAAVYRLLPWLRPRTPYSNLRESAAGQTDLSMGPTRSLARDCQHRPRDCTASPVSSRVYAVLPWLRPPDPRLADPVQRLHSEWSMALAQRELAELGGRPSAWPAVAFPADIVGPSPGCRDA